MSKFKPTEFSATKETQSGQPQDQPTEDRSLRAAAPILGATAVIISLSMGLRQSLSLFIPAATESIGISVADFTLAIGIQNLVWGVLQPFTGAVSARFGFRPVLIGGAALYAASLICVASASGLFGIVLGAGFLLGAALACTGSSFCMAVASQPVSPAARSVSLGLMAAAGSIGALFAAPIGQVIALQFGWRAGVLAFVVMAAAMLPAALVAGRVDHTSRPPPPTGITESGALEAVQAAFRSLPFVLTTLSYFVCGLQLVFIVVHLPTYLSVSGLSPMLAANALGTIGLANIAGSIFFGWLGSRCSRPLISSFIYLARSISICLFIATPPTTVGVLIFASTMGFLWLALAPLVAGTVAELFGLRWQAMIQGIALMSHQIGSFVGAYVGGIMYVALGSYDLAWRFVIALGIVASFLQLLAWLIAVRFQPARA